MSLEEESDRDLDVAQDLNQRLAELIADFNLIINRFIAIVEENDAHQQADQALMVEKENFTRSLVEKLSLILIAIGGIGAIEDPKLWTVFLMGLVIYVVEAVHYIKFVKKYQAFHQYIHDRYDVYHRPTINVDPQVVSTPEPIDSSVVIYKAK